MSVSRIDNIKAVVRMEDVLLHYAAEISYQGWGSWESIRCPFHDDSMASASVNLANDAFNCHACDARGDVIALVQYAENFPEGKDALDFLEENFDVQRGG